MTDATAPPARRAPRPLDSQSLDALAVRYVARYATTAAKLRTYLKRKIGERGWTGEGPVVDTVVTRCIDSGFIDDRAFAETRSAALARRGYGARRVAQSLSAAGIDRATIAELVPDADAALAAAERFAQRRHLGRFGPPNVSRTVQHRQFAAMVRAGHSFAHARAFLTPNMSDLELDNNEC